MAGSSSLNKSLSASSLVNSIGQYSTSEVADLVGLKATQVRHYVRRDLLSPLRGRRGEFRFSFQDVVMLRSAKVLLDADVPVRRANRVLLDLKARNADASRPLSSLRVQAEGTRVVVQEGNQAWDAESGQGTLPFLFEDSPDVNDTGATSKVATLSILGSGLDSGRPASEGDYQGFDEFASHLSSELASDLLGREPGTETDVLLSSGQLDGGRSEPAGGGPGERKRRDAALKLLETLRSAGLTDQAQPEKRAATSDSGQIENNNTENSTPDDGLVDGLVDGSVKVPEVSQLTSDDWYNLALDLEEADPEKAPAAYRQALSINPQNTDAQVNLGRLCQLRGNLKQARRHYKLALVHAPEHQLANYNMGTIYDELDEFDTARQYYAHAKDIPDAHYNLARLFEVRGDELAALRHMREYRRLLEVDISGR